MAISDVSLTAGMRTNLLNLQNTSNLLDRTQTRLSTGKRVNSALDDPVAFFTAKSHTNRASDLSAKKDGMSEAIQVIKSADKGIEAMSSLVSQAKSIVSSAKTATDHDALASQFNEILDQIGELAKDSSYGGVNLTQGATAATPEELTVEFNESGNSSLTVKGFDIQVTDPVIEGLTMTDSSGNTVKYDAGDTYTVAKIDTGGTVDATSFDGKIERLDELMNSLRSESATLSSNLSIISTRQDFTTDMINTLQEGSDNLTAADMNEEGANMLMLQTRQQLGTTALSLSSQAAQSVLRLF